MDLIWVPTGGGKTEAYLFAIASSILYSRISDNNNHGVNVIMRYTLRLLTSQQFDRASKLIVALEYIRRNNVLQLGKNEISIGLWIGKGTSNSRTDAKEILKDMVNAGNLKTALSKNTFQILMCPWCQKKESIIPTPEKASEKLEWGYNAIFTKKGFDLYCTTPQCPFGRIKKSGLPIYVTDESVYKKFPTLLFGTVDKFASVPLKQEAIDLFGNQNSRPSLIIQDELHLISGPLGSIVGAYEASFDYIMKSNLKNSSPKYIASTATIKNAENQVREIFDREVFQFPPNGIDASDNFFVKENSELHGRKYFGIMPTGKTQTTAEVRLISLMLQVINNIDLTPDEKEMFWTVTGYFNSLRELGKSASLIYDDVRDYCQQLANRNDIDLRHLKNDGDGLEELTSRVNGSEIPEILSRLNVSYEANENKAVDILIASNMLSVGVDIDRINSMFVVGQPKSTSEYIQATSRVGRKSLGAVYALYNSTKSRDRSHYETFLSYHKSMYKYVETSSVTPYSLPSLNKTIAAIIVTMVRNSNEELAGENSAANIVDHKDELLQAKEFLLKRLRNSEDKHHLYRDSGEKIINDFVKQWIRLAMTAKANDQELPYFQRSLKKSKYDFQLMKPYNRDDHEEATAVMDSMRTVEENSRMRIIK